MISYIKSSNEFDFIFRFICNFHIKYEFSYQIFSWFHISNHQISMISWFHIWDHEISLISWFHDFMVWSSIHQIPADPGWSLEFRPDPAWGPSSQLSPPTDFHELMIILMVFEVSHFEFSWFDDFPKGFQWFWRCLRSRRPWAPGRLEKDHPISWFDDIP